MTIFRILGPVEVWADERQLTLGGPRQLALLAFLAMHANRAVSSDALIDAVWGAERAGASKRLQVAIARLRRAIAPVDRGREDRLRTVTGGYLLSVGPGELDAELFRVGVEDGRRALAAGEPERAGDLLREVLGLWRGPPLAEVAFEEFAQNEIRRLEELRLVALEARIDADLQLGHQVEVLGELEALLAEQPTREFIAGRLMLALYQCGRQAEALAVYQRTRNQLANELGLEPGPALKALQNQILEQAPSLRASTATGPTTAPNGDFGRAVIAGAARRSESSAALKWDSTRPERAPKPGLEPSRQLGERERLILQHDKARESLIRPSPPPTKLPAPPTPFLGRARELAEVTALLRSENARLLTLTGAGGSGKTRLALRAAESSVSDYPDGAWFVAFAKITDPELIASTICRALELHEQIDVAPTTRLEWWLAQRQLLLVLDNLEQLSEGTAVLGELLTTCPGLRMLVTSREPLHLRGERQYEVPVLTDTDAVELFTARAQAVAPRQGVDPELAAAICERLDYLPLAIELAAARIKALSAAKILARLDRRLPLLTGGPRDAPHRQRTVKATIDWSYELLNPDERRLFARLAVFAGGCTLAAAEAVCGADLDTLEGLVDRGLVRTDGERYWMLQILREYALEQLEQTGEAETLVRERHGEHYLLTVEQSARQLATHRADEAVGVLERDIDNIRIALRWAQEVAPSWALRLVDPLQQNWRIVGDAADAKDLLECALGELDPRQEPRRYSQVLTHLSRMLWVLGRSLEAVETARSALALLPEDGPSRERARLLAWLARTELLRGRFADAARDADDAIAAAIATDDRPSQSEALNALGMAEMALGQVDRGAVRLHRALQLSREDDDLVRVESAYANLASSLNLAGRTLEALEVANEGLATIPARVAARYRWLKLTASWLAFEAGDWNAARSHLTQTSVQETGLLLIFTRLCEAELALGVGDLDTAASHLNEISPLVGSSLQAQWIAPVGALLAELRLRQGELSEARATIARTLGHLREHSDEVIEMARVVAVATRVEAEIARQARERHDVAGARDSVRRARLHLQSLGISGQAGGPVKRAWRTFATAELIRARGHSDPTAWLWAAEQWDTITRPYPAAVARWHAAGGLVELGDQHAATSAARVALHTARSLGSLWLIDEISALANRSGLQLRQRTDAHAPTGQGKPRSRGGELVPLPQRRQRRTT